jgi:uncharacterized protein (TIGR02996 family)
VTLEDALAAWARTPHPLIANAIDALGEKSLKNFAAPKAKTKEAFHAAWLSRAENADAVTIGWLAKTLREKLEVHEDHFGLLRDDYARTKYAKWFERLGALTKYASDPRVSSALCGVFEDMTLSVWDVRMTTQVYEPIASMLMGSADTRSVDRLRVVLETPTAKKQVLREVAAELLPDIIATLERLKAPLLDDEATWRAIDDRVVNVSTPTAHESQLLVHALEDESARGIYADALIERGDARGEFIALQIDGSQAALKRANTLLKKHSEAWLGPLHFVLRGCAFERGFLVEAELAQNSAATPEVWSEAARDARLATVRRLNKGRGSAEHLYDFYDGGELRSLECFDVPSHEAFAHAASFKNTVREMVLFERCSRDRAAEIAEFLLLESLTVSGPGEKLSQWVDALDRHRVFARLRKLSCQPMHSHTPYAPAFCEMRVWSGPLEVFEMGQGLRLRKSADGFVFDFSAWGAADALGRCINADKISVELAQALETAASARGVNIEPISEWPAT